MKSRIITFIKVSLLDPSATAAIFDSVLFLYSVKFIEGKQRKQCQHFLQKENVNFNDCAMSTFTLKGEC